MPRLAAHALRLLLFAAILVVIHLQHRKLRQITRAEGGDQVALEQVRQLVPEAAALRPIGSHESQLEIVDPVGQVLGRAVQTSPTADHIIGYCGPTNVLIVLGRNGRIEGVKLLDSYDTRDHVAKVRRDVAFLDSFRGLTGDDVAEWGTVDAVAGATLTSLAIQESIALRLGGAERSLRFEATIRPQQIQSLFPAASTVDKDDTLPSWWHVRDEYGQTIGTLLRTSPTSDGIIGYQGPTDAIVGFDIEGRAIGVTIGTTYDNEPYVTYVREDRYFKRWLAELTLSDLASLDLVSAEIEGVSGATMTSMAVAEGLVQAASAVRRAQRQRQEKLRWWSTTVRRSAATIGVVVAGLIVGLTRLRGTRWVRWSVQGLVVGYLGCIAGDMLSLALIAGWAQHGIAWRYGLGLVVLTFAAVAVPVTSRSNIYCSHLCPHGALQQWTRRFSPWHIRLPQRLAVILATFPYLLLIAAVVVTMIPSQIDLVDLEAFDAWHIRTAGWAAITIAVVGLAASFFSPMAYCRYGCPTGAILKAIRLNSKSGRWSNRDWLAGALLGLALVLYLS